MRFRRGDIVAWTYKRKQVFGEVRSWSGREDAHVRLIDTTGIVHRRFADSLSWDMTEDQYQDARRKLKELRDSKRGRRALESSNAPATDTFAPLPSGRGALDIQDVPLIIAQGSSSDPTKDLWTYLLQGGAERRYLRQLRQRNRQRYAASLLLAHPYSQRANIAALLKTAGKSYPQKRSNLQPAGTCANHRGGDRQATSHRRGLFAVLEAGH